jgi:hypothetical protein
MGDPMPPAASFPSTREEVSLLTAPSSEAAHSVRLTARCSGGSHGLGGRSRRPVPGRYRRSGRIVTDSTHASRDDAIAEAARLNSAARAARQRYQPLPAPRLDDWATTWLSAHLAAESTLARYRSLLRTHILPAFGRRRIDSITRQDVKAFARDLSTHLADSSVRHIITLLGQLLREAIDDHLMLFDPPPDCGCAASRASNARSPPPTRYSRSPPVCPTPSRARW